MKRAILLVLDSFGIGALPDAEKFGDLGVNTLLHIAEKYPLKLPHLSRLGLGLVASEVAGKPIPGLSTTAAKNSLYGYAREISHGKDTTSGHWEMSGVPVLFDWGYFPNTCPCFPNELIDNFTLKANIAGVLGNKHASGTAIINELGDEHLKTGKPIVYTSADSVFQIAYHETVAGGLNRLYKLCELARELLAPYNIARVIARPFLGENGDYYRTENRRDYSLLPHAPTLLDKMVAKNLEVIGIGKIPDIFAHQGITTEIVAHGHDELFEKTLAAVKTATSANLIFTNFVDFDMQYGHRRDVIGYAKALEHLDSLLPKLEAALGPNDIVIVTADHGCDPTYKGTDHTREYVPILLFGPKVRGGSIGCRKTFADIGQTLAKYFDLTPFSSGASFL